MLELDPEESDIARLEELGYEVFTSISALRGYVRRRNLAAAGAAQESLTAVAPWVGDTNIADTDARAPETRPTEASSAQPEAAAGQDATPGTAARPGTAVRASFEQAMKDVYVRAKRQANYNAGYFLEMLSVYGGLGTARRLLASPEVSSGFTALYERGRLDLTVEALVVQPRFADLFTDDEIETARQRLRDLGYSPQ